MSSYIYAIIPYKSGISFSKHEPIPCVFHPFLPELKGIESEFTEPDGLSLFADFLMINTCYRQSAFTDNKDGYNWIRAEVCQIAKALGAHEVWYVYADEETRIRRLKESRGYPEEKSRAVMARQTQDRIFRAQADFIIDNSGNFEDTKEQIRKKLTELL